MKEPRRPEGDAAGWMGTTAVIVGIAFVIFVFVNAIIFDTGGRTELQHVGPIPSGVARLSARDYIIAWSSKVEAEKFCQTDDSSFKGKGSVISTRRRIPKLESDYVKCLDPQEFGISASERVSKNLGEGFIHVFHWIPMWSALIGLLFGLVVPWRHLWYRHKKRQWDLDQGEIAARARYNLEEQRLREVVAAYARYEISQSEYDAGLQRAYEAGVPKAE